MSNLAGVREGDELFALPTAAGFVNKSWEPKPVKVHRVDPGRKLVHILRYPGTVNTATIAYRIEDGRVNDIYGASQLWRPEDWAERAKQIEEIK